MNRKIAPPIKDIGQIELPLPEIMRFDNGSALYLTHGNSLPVVKIEVVVMAGRPYETKKIISKLTGRLLKEGTLQKTAQQISAKVDEYGASFHTSANLDYITLSLHCLQKYLPTLWPLMEEILLYPSFPEREFKTYTDNSIQRLEIDLTKPEVLAYRSVTELIFGSEHPYGYNSTKQLYREAFREDMVQYHARTFLPQATKIHLSGGYTDHDVQIICHTLENWAIKGNSQHVNLPAYTNKPEKVHFELKSSIQSSLRIGRKMFPRPHPDFNDMFILNTLLGGFFGSRLNMNIREDKGMTYNIGSSLESLTLDGCLIVMADLSHSNISKAIRLIFKEFNKLREHLVEADELEQLKRYLIGNLISSVDGPFNTASLVKSMIADNVELNTWDHLIQRIHSINQHDIKVMAEKYLNPEDFWIVSAGQKSLK